MDSDTIKGLIGDKGQEAIGKTIGTMLSTDICDAVRTEFKGPLLEKFKSLLTTASKELEASFLKRKLIDAITSIKIEELKIKSGGSKIIGGAPPPIPPIPPIPPLMASTIPPAIPSQLLTGLPPIPGLESISVGSEMLKQMIGGLAPDAKEITGGLNEALDEVMVKEMLQTAIDQLINHLTGPGNDELVRMFIDILTEQINDNYKNDPKEFKDTINTVIEKKCEEVRENQKNAVADVNGGSEDVSGGGKSKKRVNRTTRKIKNKNQL